MMVYDVEGIYKKYSHQNTSEIKNSIKINLNNSMNLKSDSILQNKTYSSLDKNEIINFSPSHYSNENKSNKIKNII